MGGEEALLYKLSPNDQYELDIIFYRLGGGGALGLHFGSKKTDNISIFIEDLSRNLVFFFLYRSEVLVCMIFNLLGDHKNASNLLSATEATSLGFVLLLSTLVCCQPADLIWAFVFH